MSDVLNIAFLFVQDRISELRNLGYEPTLSKICRSEEAFRKFLSVIYHAKVVTNAINKTDNYINVKCDTSDNDEKNKSEHT